MKIINLLLRIIIFAIGFIIVLIAILMIDKRDSLSTFLFIIAIGIMLIGIVFARMTKNIENESLIEVDTKAESVTEPQSVKTSAVKVAILNKYNRAEIISSDKPDKGYFISDGITYYYEADGDNLKISAGN